MVFTLVASACGSSEVSTDSTGSTLPIDVAVDSATTGTVGPPEPHEGDPTVSLEWTEAGLSGERFIEELIATDQGFIVYRFFDGPQAWVSEDGIVWTEADLDFGTANEAELDEVAIGGPGYLALGGTSDHDDVLLTSEDGLTWRQQDLDLEKVEVTGYEFAGLESVVAGPDGLVIQGSLTRIGVDEHRFVVWASTDGTTWDLVEDPFGPGAYVWDILPTEDGFVTYGYVEGLDGGDRIWWSSDGRSWEGSSPDFISDGFLVEPGLVRWSDKILAAIQTEDGIKLWTSTDGRTWEQLPASPTLERTDEYEIGLTEVAAGPFGIVLTAELEPPRQPLPLVVIEKDDLVLTVELEGGRVTVFDGPNGSVMFEVRLEDEDVVVIDEDDGSITIVSPDTGENLTSFTFEEFGEAQNKAFERAGIDDPGSEEPQLIPVLFFSPDGERWRSVEIEEITGSAEFPRGTVVGDDAVILRFDNSTENEGEFEDDSETDIFLDVPELLWVGRLADGQ